MSTFSFVALSGAALFPRARWAPIGPSMGLPFGTSMGFPVGPQWAIPLGSQ